MTMTDDQAVLVLRLAGPLQSWGSGNEYNRRDTRPEPTKSGVLGLLAAAQGRRRSDDITDLLELDLGVRVDQPGNLLRDYHTASDYRGVPLRSATVTGKGEQKPTSPAKRTHVTQRFYLQDAVFVAAVLGPRSLLAALRHALRNPAFPLALGRRCCAPTGPIVLDTRSGDLTQVLGETPWQASAHAKNRYERRHGQPAKIDLPVTIDDRTGTDQLADVPTTFDPLIKTFTSRHIRHGWVSAPTGFPEPDHQKTAHDPFALLGW